VTKQALWGGNKDYNIRTARLRKLHLAGRNPQKICKNLQEIFLQEIFLQETCPLSEIILLRDNLY